MQQKWHSLQRNVCLSYPSEVLCFHNNAKRTTANNELFSIRDAAIELTWWTHSSFIFNSWEFRCIQVLCPVFECIASKVGIRGLQDWNFYRSFSRSAFASPYFCELSESRLKSKKARKEKKIHYLINGDNNFYRSSRHQRWWNIPRFWNVHISIICVYSSGLSLSEKKHLGMKLYVQNSRGHMNSQKFTMQKVKPYKKKCTPLLSLNIGIINPSRGVRLNII